VICLRLKRRDDLGVDSPRREVPFFNCLVQVFCGVVWILATNGSCLCLREVPDALIRLKVYFDIMERSILTRRQYFCNSTYVVFEVFLACPTAQLPERLGPNDNLLITQKNQ
jgi:hypothetical protein